MAIEITTSDQTTKDAILLALGAQSSLPSAMKSAVLAALAAASSAEKQGAGVMVATLAAVTAAFNAASQADKAAFLSLLPAGGSGTSYSFSYDAQTSSLLVTPAGGATQSISLAEFVTATELVAALAGYAQAGHSHSISDVAGLQGALDARAPSTNITEAMLSAEVSAKLNTVGSGGSSLPASVSFSLTWDTAASKDMGSYTATSTLAFVSSDTSSVVGGSTFAVVTASGFSATFDGVASAGWATSGVNIVGLYRVGNHIIWTVNGTQAARLLAVPTAPAWTSAPSLSAAVVGTAVTPTAGVSTGYPTPTITYQWQSPSGTNISGATSASYTPLAGQVGQTLRRVDTATNASGSATTQTNAVTVGASATAPGAPTLSGVTSITATGLTYTYADPASNGGSAITSRNADITFDAGATWTAITAPVVGSNTITFASSGTARTAQIRARATNAVGSGSYGTATGIAVPAQTGYSWPTTTTNLRGEPGYIEGTESGSYAAGWTYTAAAADQQAGSARWRSETVGPATYAVGTGRLVVKRHRGAAATTTQYLAIQGFKLSSGADAFDVILLQNNHKIYTAGVESDITALPADTGQTATWVRGANWAAVQTVGWNAAFGASDFAVSLQATSGALRFSRWSGSAWQEVGVYRPTAGIGTGLVANDWVMYMRLVSNAAGTAAGDWISVGVA